MTASGNLTVTIKPIRPIESMFKYGDKAPIIIGERCSVVIFPVESAAAVESPPRRGMM
jgi:hypothetical protein